jgi:peptidoglycan/LPS O-acetylase OafA/YrhL
MGAESQRFDGPLRQRRLVNKIFSSDDRAGLVTKRAGSTMRRNLPLDGLRAVAVVFVIGSHSGLFPGGWIGVDVFFTLSGFLITSILMKELKETGSISIKNFYMRRILRLTPAYLSVILFLLIVSLFSRQGAEIRTAALVSALYATNWAMATGWWPAGYSAHLWSLAAEEQFYLIWPVTLMVIAGWRPAVWVGAAILAIIAWRFALVYAGASWPRVTFGLDTRGAALLVGCLVALVGVERLGRIAWPFVSGVGLGVILLTTRVTEPLSTTFATFAGAACAASTVVSLHRDGWLTRALALRPFVYTGKISYGLYLWSFPVTLGGAQYNVGGSRPLYELLLIALTFLIAATSYKFLELPFLRMKHWFPRGARPSTGLASGYQSEGA